MSVAEVIKYDTSEPTEKVNNIITFPNSNNTPTPMKKSRPEVFAKAAESIASYDDFKKIQNYFLSQERYRDNMLWVVGIALGLRASDLLQIRMCDIFTKDGEFKPYLLLREMKTGKMSSNHDDKCLITPAAQEAIMLYIDNCDRKIMMTDYLFYSNKRDGDGNKVLKPESVHRIMKEAQRACDIGYNMGSHTLRKSFVNIAMCVSGGYNLDMSKLLAAQTMLKHESFKTTLKYLNKLGAITEQARYDVSDFLLGKTNVNDLGDSLLKNNQQELIKSLTELISTLSSDV